MKTFIAACVLLGLLTIGVCTDAVLLTKETDQLEEIVAKLPTIPAQEREGSMRQLQEIWEEKRILFVLSVNQNDIEDVEDSIARLSLTAQEKSDSNFLVAVAELQEGIKRMRELVGFSPEGIL